ncbi:MAG: proprotein convertase P-domain-containing protein [Bacteroidota bacterium]|nr:proprotein convertase P-domain-containing protein [Bacteroidota bacterium]
MKKLLLFIGLLSIVTNFASAQCSTTNATSCVCETPGATNCNLLPDIIVARPPLLVSGNNGIIEYSQTGNGVENGRLRVSVSSPNIGHGPLEIRTTNTYICGTDTITGTAPATCPSTGLPPRQLIKQRVYQKNGAVMNYTDRDAGSMTYHPTHGHMHVDNWGVHSLRTQTSDPNPLNWPIVGNGAKLAFCLMDYGSCSTYNGHCVDSTGATLTNSSFPNYGLGGGAYNCSPTVQGISSGFTDIYYQYLDGMYITIPPGTCNGQYFLVVQLDPNNYFLEEDETNNVLVVPYTLTKQAGTVPVITANGSTALCPGSSVTLTSSPAPSYLWSNGATTQSITVNAAGTYTVTTDIGSACPASSAPISITVQTMPVTVTPVTNSLCSGQSTILNSSVTAPANGTVQTTFSNNTVYAIPDNNSAGVVSPITVSGINPATLSNGAIVSVRVNITHTYDGDIVLALISPSGNTINLSNRRGGSGDNYNNTVFSMSAATPIASGAAPFAGSYIPEASFNLLTGNANGTWQLKVTDLANADVGTINSWSLILNNLVPTQINYSWTSSPAGFTSTVANPVVSPTVTTTYSLIATNSINGCTGSASAQVTVNPIPVVQVSGTNVICNGASTVLTASGASAYSWSPGTALNTTSGAVVSASPVTTITYTVTGTSAAGCSAAQTYAIQVNPLPQVTMSPLNSVCNSSPSFLLTQGSPTGGVYTGTGVVNGNFDPAVAGTGTHLISYTYTNSNSCQATATQSITVGTSPVVTLAPINAVCTNTTSFTLSGGSPSGGSYSGTGVNGGVFNPSTAGAGTHTITYFYSGGASCDGSATTTITVNTAPVVTLSSFQSVCSNATSFTLTGGSPSGGTYSGTGVTSGTFNPSVAGSGTHTIAYNFTNANGCSGSATSSITVNAAPVVSLASFQPVCSNATSYTLTGGSPSGGIYSGAGVSSGIFNPSVAGVGTHIITYSYTNANGCSGFANSSITVNTVPVVTLAPFSSVCSNVAAFTLTGGSPSGGTYSGPGVSSGIFNPATAGAGTHTITYSYSNNGCNASATNTITVTNCGCTNAPATPAAIQGISTPCRGQSYTYSIAAVSGATSYTWSAPANSTITSGQGTNSVTILFANNFNNGNVCVTATNACGTSASRCKSLARSSAVTPGYIQGELYGHCQAVVNLSIAPVNGAISYDWILPSGTTYISGQGTTAITFSTNTGFVSGQVCVTSFNGCSTSSSRCINIYSAPAKPSAINGPAAVCAQQTGVAFNVATMYGATTYTWTVPSGSNIVSGQGTNSIVVNFGNSSGKITCSAKNSCGNRGTLTKNISMNCRLQPGSTFTMEVAPNPARDRTAILLDGLTGNQVRVIMINVLGKEVLNKLVAPDGNSIELDLSALHSGVYHVSVWNGNERRSTRLVVD